MTNRSRVRCLVALVLTASAAAEASAATVALLPVRQAARRPEIGLEIELALGARVRARADLVDVERTRAAMRRRRLRSVDAADTATLRELAAELGADWLIVAAVHDAPRAPAPDVAISGRLYDGATGRLAWSGFAGASGLDYERLLGIGRVERFDALAERAAGELLAPLERRGAGLVPPPAGTPARRIGTLAIAPFTATVGAEALEVSLAATEALREVLGRRGARLAEPACVRSALREGAHELWGELTAPARATIRESCDAELLITGSIERWEIGGTGIAPEPILAVAVRLIDAASGRIVWTGSLEAGGWDRPGLLGLNRVYSRGELLHRLLDRIGKQLLAADLEGAAAMESSS